MKLHFFYIIITLQVLFSDYLYGQTDITPPNSPVLSLVTIKYPSGSVELTWSLSTSPDVSGYVVYSFLDNAGYNPDTLYDPYITSYIRGAGSPYFSESFVVAAIDSSGNISPLSNELNTIFIKAEIDTCSKKIEIKWNSYSSFPKKVLSYTLLVSEDGGSYYEAGEVPSDINTFVISDFKTDEQYCYRVRANIEGGYTSSSIKKCILTKMERPPLWINADYATVTEDNKVALSFTIEPFSEITRFRLEKRAGLSESFQQIAQPVSVNGSVIYTDNEADVTTINYYRLLAINNCNNPITVSNISSNMVLSLVIIDNDLKLSWNSCKEWSGFVSSYRLYINTGRGFEERELLQPSDTLFTLSYNDIMYEVSGNEVCFYINALETANPHDINGQSNSSVVCTSTIENITVPDLFTPNNDLLNDYFKPILSFTPVDYHLIISDRQGHILFETHDYLAEWNGSGNGNLQPQGVCLWFLKITAPSGKSITRTGTITIINNRQ